MQKACDLDSHGPGGVKRGRLQSLHQTAGGELDELADAGLHGGHRAGQRISVRHLRLDNSIREVSVPRGHRSI